MTAKAWLLAARPRTLPAAAAPVVVGSALAWADGAFAPLAAASALLGALLLQVGANLANDYYDHAKGADTADRVGPLRATQAGLLPPAHVRNAAFGVFAAAVLVGLYLVAVGGWPILAVGLASLVAGWAYTGGPYPLGYHGLGDVFAFLFFGPVAVAGTYWVQALALTPEALLVGVPVGLLTTAILVVNNVRDADTDARAGKRTLVVRLGRRAGRAEYALLTVTAYALLPVLVAVFDRPWTTLLPFLALPFGARLVVALAKESGAALNARLAATAQHLLVFSVLLAVGLVVL